MSESFPLTPDADWYEALVARFGDAVPLIAHLRIRRGLQDIVGSFFEFLNDNLLIDRVTVYGIETRAVGWTIIDIRDCFDLPYGVYGFFEATLVKTQQLLAESCEHCGRPGEIIAKTGLEALLNDPGAVLGDRFLCLECYKKWRA